MKIAAFIAVSALLLFVVYEAGAYMMRGREAARRLQELELKLSRARGERDKLEADMLYYKNPDNFEKELRARFNYKLPSEKLVIVVSTSSPLIGTSTPTSTR